MQILHYIIGQYLISGVIRYFSHYLFFMLCEFLMKYFIFQRPNSQFSVSFVQVVPEGRNKTLDISIVYLNATAYNKNLIPKLRELGSLFSLYI